MKVAIIGGGICGLSTYLNLQKHVVQNWRLEAPIEITIYESHVLKHDSNTRKGNIPSSGGGYGLAPNGMASLRRLDPDIHEQILRRGFPSPKTTLKSARGWTLGTLPFVDTRGGHTEACIMVLRQVVLDALYERIPESAVVHQKIVEVEDGDDSATIKLENGEKFTFDLIIGADGVWSKSRKAVLGDRYSEYDAIYKYEIMVWVFSMLSVLTVYQRLAYSRRFRFDGLLAKPSRNRPSGTQPDHYDIWS